MASLDNRKKGNLAASADAKDEYMISEPDLSISEEEREEVEAVLVTHNESTLKQKLDGEAPGPKKAISMRMKELIR